MPFLGVATSGKIVDLRNLLSERFPQPLLPTASRLITGLRFLDSVIGGGLPKGVLTELISPQISAGSASLISALLEAASRDSYFIALIDGRDSFDPEPFDNRCLGHLLWVRCGKTLEAIKATDLLLRDGNFPLVIVDLVLNAADEFNIPQTTWYRLQRLVKLTSTACLVLTRRSTVGSAQLKLILENIWNLTTFEEANHISGLQIRIQRSYLAESPMETAEAI